MSFHDFEMRSIDGATVPFSSYAGRVCLVVNVASECGATPQYAGLRALYEAHKDQGLVVLGIPCNQFGKQEPGTNAEILAFAQGKYDVTFPMFEKVDVKGDDAAPLYAWLSQQAPQDDGSTDVRWNFEKFLVDRDGKVVRRFGTKVTSEALTPDVVALL